MEKILTSFIDVEAPHTIEVARAHGVYDGLKKSIAMDRDELIASFKASGLRGRGGAGFPCGVKMSFMPKDPSPQRPSYLICNADESEPGTFKDRVILEKNPHLLIEGMMISSYAMRCSCAFLYIRGEYGHAARVLFEAVEEARKAGFVGKNILGSGWDCDLVVHRGAAAYICGEETALMDSLEGGRGNPRLKPPFPAQAGLYGCPTTINNVETLACLPYIVEHGPEAFAAIGRNERNTGPKLFAVSGHVKNPGVFELPMGTPLMELIEDHCGGMLRPDKKLKAVIPGGSSVPILRAEECQDLPLDFDAVAERGSMFGSAAVMVMDETTDMVKVLARISHFYSHESCGQCTPCREGTPWLEKVLQRIVRGEGREGDLALLDDMAARMMGTTICPLADAAAMPVRSFVEKFREEFEYYIKHGRSMVSAG